MKRYKQLATAGVALSIVGILAGCSTANTDSNQTVSSAQAQTTGSGNGTNSAINTTTNHTGSVNSSPSSQAVTSAPKINEKSYSNISEAINAITSIEQQFGQVNPSGPPVDLGSGIKADFSGAAGTYSYKWHEGNWTILFRGWGESSLGTQLAKNIVAYLNTHTFPAPQKKGVITVIQPSTSKTPKMSQNTIAWQVGKKVYQLNLKSNPINVLMTIANSHKG